MRKTRSDSVLLNLPEEQQAKLAEWMLSGVPYHECKQLAEKEFGVVLRSLSPFAGFWREVCQPHLMEKRRRSAAGAEARSEEAQKNPAKFDRATLDAIQQRAYELAENPHSAPKDVKAVMMLLLKARDQDFEREKLALDVQKYHRDTCGLFIKWSADQRAKEIATGNASNNEKIQALGKLMFGEDF